MSADPSTSGRVPDPGIRQLYRLESRWQTWLDVEAALAQAQAELGIVPADAAATITATARLELLDRERIDEATLRTSHTLVPLVWELARAAGEDAGRWVHWGATTQNVVQTGDLLTLRRAHHIFLGLLADALSAMADLAEAGADLAMPARTHGQHAVPMTFGYKVATWIDEISRTIERLRGSESRTFVALLGGAAGTFASMGAQGPAVQAGVAARLGLTPMAVPARSIGDHLAEYVCVLGLLGGTGGRIAREVYTLMKTEYGEVEEPMPPGTVGSSTMPQKRNPQLCQDMVAAAASLRASVPLALESMQIEHEADRSMSLIMREATERACVTTGELLSRLVVVLSGLRLNPDRMRRNLDLTDGLIMSEAVMLRLGEVIGRQEAHDVVYEAAQAAAVGGGSLASLLSEDPRVSDHLTADAIGELLDPSTYTGLTPAISRDAAARAREVAERTWAALPSAR
ncbi:MAG: adenylosuccinate lyase family protein [Actinomycetota bacterium]|nr:adenylosuccinate lyase family protein [Actinomycetota bacterium]